MAPILAGKWKVNVGRHFTTILPATFSIILPLNFILVLETARLEK